MTDDDTRRPPGPRADAPQPRRDDPAQRAGASPPRTPGELDDPDDARLPPDLWDRAAVWLMQRGALPALAVITLGMVVIYAGVFGGELAGDDLTFHLAESARIADCLRDGDLDLWNPSANAGFASAYYYQVVPHLMSAAPAALFGHHLFFFQLAIFLPLVLAPAAAYRGARLLGATPWQAALAALAIAMLHGESRWGTGATGTFHVGLHTQTWAFAAFPLALGHAARWATAARGLAPAIAWSAFVTLCHPFAGIALGGGLFAGWVAQIVLDAVDRLLGAIGRRVTGDPRGGLWAVAVAALGERWRNPPPRPWLGELLRLVVLGVCLIIACLPIGLPLVIDYEGFGGFPHRVSDEVGPGLALLRWFAHGEIFDHARPHVLTWLLPLVAVLARTPFLRWLWAPAVLYALLLGTGPYLPKTQDDLFPMVRFLGAFQVVCAIAIGAGGLALAVKLWNAEEGSPLARAARLLLVLVGLAGAGFIAYSIATAPHGSTPLVTARRLMIGALSQSQARWVLLGALAVVVAAGFVPAWRAMRTRYGLRTALAALAAALGVLLTLPGARALASRVRVLGDYAGSHGDQLHAIAWYLQLQPPGRKQVGSGAENHWWNLLTYEYGRRPALLMMGGGGLQASPNYDFLWSMRDFTKNAWIYDAPILVFQTGKGEKMPAGELILQTRHYTVRRLPAPGLVSPVRVTGTLPPDPEAAHTAAIAWVKTDQAIKDEVLAYAGSGGAGPAPHGTVVRAFRQPSPGDAADIYAEVDVTESTTFAVRESWHPRWRAYIDGAPAPIRRVTPNFSAVDVSPGRHAIALRFERPWWAHAAWLACPLVPLAAWLVTRRRKRRSAPAGPPG